MFKCVTLIFFFSFNFLLSQQTGKASYYDNRLHGGKPTKSGEIFYDHLLTAASNTYKMGTIVNVTNTANNKSVQVKINDTGGFSAKKYGYRIIDLSKAAFASIADIRQGIITVMVEVVN